MALGASWWSGAGAASRWSHDFTNTTLSFLNFNMLRLHIGETQMYQRPMVKGGTGGNQMVDPGFDSGYFSLSTSSTVDDEQGFSQAFATIGNFTTYTPQCVMIEPAPAQGDVAPEESTFNSYDLGCYYTGFCIGDGGGSGFAYKDHNVWFATPAAGNYYIWHYNPWAWFGTVPEVIAAAVMQAGLDSDYIDTTAFDNAHDAFDYSTGDAPWTSCTEDWTIYAYRKVGQKMSDFIFECARHARDFYFVNEQGKLSVNSFTSPNVTITSLDYSDGVMGVVDWENTLEHMFNTIDVTWGSCTRQSGDHSNEPTNSDFSASFEPNLDSYTGSKWLYSDSDSGSTARYGEIPLKGQLTKINHEGQPDEIYKAHYPFLLSPHHSSYPTSGEMYHVSHWLSSDSQPRKIITVKQDLRGLDFGVGDEVQDVSLTSDGATVGVTKCIKKKYDFRTLTVESTLMEIPS